METARRAERVRARQEFTSLVNPRSTSRPLSTPSYVLLADLHHRLRPVGVQREEGWVFTTVRRTSLLLIRVTGDTWRNLRHKLNRLHLGHPRHPDGRGRPVLRADPCTRSSLASCSCRITRVFDFTAYQLTREPYPGPTRRAYHVLIKTYTHVFAGQHAKPTDQSEQVSGRD